MSKTQARSRRGKLPKVDEHSFRSNCSISRTLELLGDKWTLLIVRDLMWHGKSTFKELADAEGIPTNLLSNRLQRLIDWGLARRKRYQDNPVRYTYYLTDAGLALEETLLRIMAWGNRYLDGGLFDPGNQGRKDGS
ncbi:MAG: helix-turn-helix domain-containing protein [Pseudomonadota bacterium]